ncbi:hypothetical protein LPTSP3_g30490 [Leptospira kobayashii]|uniref:Uncharacterized protein n=1 Tax=Leptospira kobayashii TaxID=1917830 RepID=A0ABN6KG08_9LEPT|nr:hypothetical protein [Leptospira kobayashii]BDA80119.1 hypothetical protein LPTSP3_g30490 [Leptospira kobayashii]
MNKELAESEVKALLEKIRTDYRENAKLHPKAFDIVEFEKRYLQILQLRGNITKFISEEVVFLEQLKSKYKELVAKKEAGKGETLNRIMDESLERLSKYSKIDFHPMAKTEIRYFYGAMVDFAEIELPVLLNIFKGTIEFSQIQDSIVQIERIGVTRRGMPSLRIQEAVKNFLDANGNTVMIEKVSQNLLKDGCFALKNLATSIHELVSKNRVNPDLIIRINEKDFPKASAEFNGRKFGESLDRVTERCIGIIQDFRMNALLGMDN